MIEIGGQNVLVPQAAQNSVIVRLGRDVFHCGERLEIQGWLRYSLLKRQFAKEPYLIRSIPYVFLEGLS